MKKITSILTTALVLLGIISTGFCASALAKSGSCGTNVKYSFNSSTGALTVYGKGAMANYSTSKKSPFSSDKTIKSAVIKKEVTSIGSLAFYNCTGLKKITILNSACKISDSKNTISSTAVIYGKANSTAQAYAKKYGRTFKDLSKECPGHSYKTSVTKATMSADGKIVKTCSICGKKTTTVIYKIASVSLSETKYYCDSSVKTPSVTVKNSKGKALKKNTDYTVSYASGRKAAGTYNVTVTFKGNYSGKKTLSFKIVNVTTNTKAGIMNLYKIATGKGQYAKYFDKTRSTVSDSKMPAAFADMIKKFLGIGEKNIFKNKDDNGVTFTYKDKDNTRKYLLNKSKLTDSDVTSATCKTSGSNYIVVLKVKSGSSSSGKEGSGAKNNSPLDKTGICTGNRDIDIYDHKTAEICAKAGGKFIKSVSESTKNITVTATINKTTLRVTNLVIKFDIAATINAAYNLGTVKADGTTTVNYKNFKY